MRYLRSRRRSGYTSAVLSVAGIAVGVMTLTCVLAVMNGFQLSFIESIPEVNSYHVRLSLPAGSSFDSTIVSMIRELEEVATAVEITDDRAMIAGVDSSYYGCVVRGVPTDIMQVDEGMAQQIEVVEGTFDVSGPNTIVIGSELSRRLGVWTGDSITLFAASGTYDQLFPEEQDFTVVGLFSTGYQEFDLSWTFISGDSACAFFGSSEERPAELWIKLANRFRDRQAIGAIRDVLPYGGAILVSWREYNRSFFGALLMEKIWMMVLFGLIFVVVGFNIAHSLRRAVFEKREDIGVLKALGAPAGSMQSIFVLEGFLIGVLGGVIGTMVGLFVSNNINDVFAAAETVVNAALAATETLFGGLGVQVGFSRFSIFSSAHFYIAEVPVRVFFLEVFLTNAFAVVSSTIAALWSASRVVEFNPATILRYE